ncbi:hypothetical protein H072_8864 [Dactylellina haptotyla CBS 200.50]|uniref:Uncharacterized protein n=1 Tax=Dactylellina haptotyla (strain CBS 200.50) TaxID=1284197 RepID=S8A363_DACHA|nr:hypothetical protein H072_8864 [Dactylellina haptotyla CBS 200.50]
MAPTIKSHSLKTLQPSLFSSQSSRTPPLPIYPRRSLVFFLHRRSRPRPVGSPNFHPWNYWSAGENFRNHWLSKLNLPRRYDELEPGWAKVHLKEWLRIACEKQQYLNRMVQVKSSHHWTRGWTDATNNTTSIHASLMKSLHEMSREPATATTVKRKPTASNSGIPGNLYQSSSPDANTAADSNEDAEVDPITLKRIFGEHPDAIRSQVAFERTGGHGIAKSTNHVKAPDMNFGNIALQSLENYYSSFDSGREHRSMPNNESTVRSLPAENKTDYSTSTEHTPSTDPNLSLMIQAHHMRNVDPLILPQATIGTLDATKKSALAQNEYHNIEYQISQTETWNEDSATNTSIPHSAETNLNRPNSNSSTKKASPDINTASGIVQRLSPADLIASLRYYDTKRGSLPDEEPLSAEDIAFLKSTRVKQTGAKEATTSNSRMLVEDYQAEPTWKSKAKKVGAIISSIVVGTYIIGVGNKLFFTQPESMAAAEMLSAVRRSRKVEV